MTDAIFSNIANAAKVMLDEDNFFAVSEACHLVGVDRGSFRGVIRLLAAQPVTDAPITTEHINRVISGLRPMNGSNEMDAGVTLIEALAQQNVKLEHEIERLMEACVTWARRWSLSEAKREELELLQQTMVDEAVLKERQECANLCRTRCHDTDLPTRHILADAILNRTKHD